MRLHTTFSSVFKGLIVVSVVLFLSAAGFQDKNISGWYRQYITNLNGSTIKDMTFLDSLTGFAVTNSNTSLQEYILKTTNGGDNWFINYTYTPSAMNIGFTRIQFADNNIGYASVYYFDFFKTTDGGGTWTNIPNVPFGAEDMSVVNKDTVLVVTSSGFGGGVYRSTNGGLNWQLIWTLGVTSGNPSRIYMFDKNMGFSCYNFQSPYFRKTTNGGFNWFDIADDDFYDIKFIDSLIGWKGNGSGIKKTTNGGINWTTQTIPNLYSNLSQSLSVINKDTIWSAGSNIFTNNQFYGTLLRTTNGGLNWGYQIPDTSFAISRYRYITFINNKVGWAYNPSLNIGIHTKIGGNDTTYYTAINNNTTMVPEDYELYQNYPNPFNPFTTIKFALKFTSDISLEIFDMKGVRIKMIIDNKKINSGTYEYGFDGSNYSSGVYFYKLTINNKSVITKKMIMIK